MKELTCFPALYDGRRQEHGRVNETKIEAPVWKASINQLMFSVVTSILPQVIMDHIEKLEKQARTARNRGPTMSTRSPHSARCHS